MNESLANFIFFTGFSNKFYFFEKLSICKSTLDSMIYRKKVVWEEDNLKNKLVLIEEYREWITEGIFESNALYLIDKR